MLTYLSQVRTSTIPKAERRRDWLRPLWLLGMLLYMYVQRIVVCSLHFVTHIMSQILTTNRKHPCVRVYASRYASQTSCHDEYMIFGPQIEYVAPLGSSSLIFNFLFARFLVGTPVTSNDIYVSSLPASAGFLLKVLIREPSSLFLVSLG